MALASESVITPVLIGCVTALSLIAAIGAQNAFVLQQGIKRQFVVPVVLICAISDTLLEFAGVAGIGFVIERAPIVLELFRWGGVAFLLWYAYGAIRRAVKPMGMEIGVRDSGSRRKTLLACLAITFLNPHVYLDTMILMGSIGNAQGDPEKWWFAAGGAFASFAWFALLGFGARGLTRFFASPRAWQVLDWCVAAVMLVIAARLVFGGPIA